jgi:hypothetical protein
MPRQASHIFIITMTAACGRNLPPRARPQNHAPIGRRKLCQSETLSLRIVRPASQDRIARHDPPCGMIQSP